MSRIYDNWERLVGATLKREEFRELARAPSFSSTSSDFSPRFSFSSPIHNHIPVNPEASSSSSIPFYSGESSGESLPKPRSEDGQPNANAKPIRFKELKKATRNFRPDSILREEGLGLVFKGWINEHTLTAAKPGSGMTVAIKKWNTNSIYSMEALKKWLIEANYLSLFRHPNLIKLIAYCDEGDILLLVYEFMPKGSLDNHLLRRMEGDDNVFVPQVHVGAIPQIGQEFETLDDVYNFYNEYAKLVGFSARIVSSRKNA